MTQNINVVVLAAGKGTRMQSALPKVLHRVGGTTLLQHNINLAQSLNASQIKIVIGHGAELIENSIEQSIGLSFCLQEEQLGTGHAVAQALPQLDGDAVVLVLYGDVPLLQPATLTALLAQANANTVAVLTCNMPDPSGLGRIIRDGEDQVVGIVEEKDASAAQKRINEINTGIMAIPVRWLQQWLPRLSSNNAQREYYLTDIIAMAREDGCEVVALCCEQPMEVMGVNNRVQLAQLERYYQQQAAKRLMLAGVTLADPERIDIRGDVTVAQDITIDINVVLEGKITIGKNVSIGPNCVIRNTSIADDSIIEANCHIEDSVIGSGCSVGPFARLRYGTVLKNQVRIGNFVETKKSIVGDNSKVNHLSYIGDSELGQSVNIGAGTITCNYDGVNKFNTTIGDHVFVGSNTALVAPLTLGSGSTIGAGSTITRDVPANELALTRAKQQIVPGWKRPVKKNK